MQEMITGRRALGIKEERDDVFTALLQANEFDDAENRLSDQELIGEFIYCHFLVVFSRSHLSPTGNIFMFLIAGHEVRFSE